MATYVVITEDDQWIELATYVASLKSKNKEEPDAIFLEECQNLLNENKKVEFLSKLLNESPLILNEQLKDSEGFYLVVTLLFKEIPKNSAEVLINKITQSLTSDPKDKPIFRLKLLSNFHNVLTEVNQRFIVFNTMLNFAIASKQVRLLESYFANLDERLKSYQTKLDQTRSIYKSIRNYFRETNQKNLELEWTLKYLSSFESGNNETESEAITAIVDSIKASGIYQFDELLRLGPIKALENGSANGKKGFQLLKFFIEESWTSFKDFSSSNTEFLKTNGIDLEEASRKLRLLTLCNLAASNSSLSYSLIAKHLQINENEVEFWVINAIGENILEAKLDQRKEIVLVTRALHRVFTKDNWKQLAENLATLKENISGLKKVIEDCSQQQNALLRSSQK